MRYSYSRVALLAGASIAALGLANAASAAPHDGLPAGTYAGEDTADTDIVICDLASTADCFFGVIDDTNPASAALGSAASGRIYQYGSGADVALSLANAAGDTAELGAVANGSTYANASVYEAIWQSALASDEASVDLTNDGTLIINALAAAAYDTAPAVASAAASYAVYQYANSTDGGTAHVGLHNNGYITVAASAVVTGGGTATPTVSNTNPAEAGAYALIYAGINQSASATGAGGLGYATLVNAEDAEINLNANAAATANTGNAWAEASVNYGIFQGAYGYQGANALASLTNDGVINIGAGAIANASTDAHATAEVVFGVNQLAYAGGGGDATASLVNYGTVNAVAAASAYGSNAYALAVNQSAIAQVATADSTTVGTGTTAVVNPGGDAAVNLTNAGLINIAATAKAYASDGAANAVASVENAIYQLVDADGYASAVLSNVGTLAVAAAASAVGTSDASASASLSDAVHQSVEGAIALAYATNSGSITLDAGAYASAASGSAAAYADANNGIDQDVFAADTGSAVAVNDGIISLNAHAVANAYTSAYAQAYALGGINQYVEASVANAVVTNTGGIYLTAAASANGSAATAVAYALTGVEQYAAGAATASLNAVNYGTVALSANAVANATDGGADASAVAQRGIAQDGDSNGLANVEAVNNGTISLVANATANGLTSADALARARYAMIQEISATSVYATMTNAGTVIASANAAAIAYDSAAIDSANANAFARGLVQAASGANLQYALVNSGTLKVAAHAYASANDYAYATADAVGVIQALNGTDSNIASFTNSGAINVYASAVAVADDAAAISNAASAVAYGYHAIGGAAYATLTAVNSGTILANATAVAPDTAYAHAVGMYVTGVVGEVSVGNEGAITAAANASGGTASAYATGIGVDGGLGAVVVDNSGTISVHAITNDGSSNATGIRVVTSGAYVGDPEITTINNSGDIIVRNSTDGGETWTRGYAIDVAGSDNPTVINLLGGNIYGHIDVNAGDVINVTDDETAYDGIINPECEPAAHTLSDNPALSSCGQGTLNINNGGTLLLQDPRVSGDPDMYDGPSYAYVNTLDLRAPTGGTAGTLALGLEPSAAGAQPAGSYPQLYANTAYLDGTLEARITTPNGLLADEYSWDNVIDANTRTGEFDQCVLGGGYTDSLLLDLQCSYDAQNNVDLALTRIAFNDVAGLNQNGISVGTGLEGIYDPSLTGGIADLLADLFLFSDPVNYNIALNQLSGSAYANYLQSFPSLGVHYNDLLDHATNCEIPGLAGSVLECRVSPIHVWGQLDYQWRKADGDVEAGSMKSKRLTGLLGLDVNLGSKALVGASAGYVTNHTRDHQFGDTVDAEGMQVGVYGVYDPGAFYVKGVTTYSWYDGDSQRHIDFAGLAPGATYAARLSGDPDVRMWTLGLHGGYRVPLAETSVLTPYLNLDYVDARIKGFTERTVTGDEGAELTVYRGRAAHTFLTGGVKWATQLGGVVPELNVGYRYRFGEKRSDFDAAFLGDADAAFNIISASQKRGTLLAGLSIGGKLGPVDLRIGYEGEYNSDVTSHSGNFKLVLPLGGAKAPPPPPVVEAAPPPPPEAAPPPPEPTPLPPPPPPIIERGERGQ